MFNFFRKTNLLNGDTRKSPLLATAHPSRVTWELRASLLLMPSTMSENKKDISMQGIYLYISFQAKKLPNFKILST